MRILKILIRLRGRSDWLKSLFSAQDCAEARTDLNLCLAHMSEGTFSRFAHMSSHFDGGGIRNTRRLEGDYRSLSRSWHFFFFFFSQMIHYPPSESQGLQQSENQGFRSPQDAASDQSFNLFTCYHSPSDFIHIYRQLNVCLLFFFLFVCCCCFLFAFVCLLLFFVLFWGVFFVVVALFVCFCCCFLCVFFFFFFFFFFFCLFVWFVFRFMRSTVFDLIT